MYIRLIRNKPQGSAITGRLVINGRWFCNTLERVGYQIPALCYRIAVTQSPKFKRLLPLVTGVPRTPQDGYGTATPIGRANGAMGYRQGIRIHRGSKPEHSTGCVLVVGDNMNDNIDNLRANQLPGALKENIGCRSAADVEQSLTQLLLQTQETHEEIILEVIDFRPGTDYGYDTPCPSSECACEKEIRSANFARRHPSSILEPPRLSDDC